jgi:hypothetical protein
LLVTPVLIQPAHELGVDEAGRERNDLDPGRERFCQIVPPPPWRRN